MKIGVDFDGVIVSVDRLIHRLALEGGLLSEDIVPRAAEMRAHLLGLGQESRFSTIEDAAYGVWHATAPALPGVHDFFRRCRKRALSVAIVGQRSGDLWTLAQDWLARQGFFNPYDIALSRASVFFEATVEQQAHRVRALGCTHFISERAAILENAAFPPDVRKILFEPTPTDTVVSQPTTRARGWNHISEFFLAPGTR
ncbi:MAG: hypothetical protein QOI66_4598 [Myxococcales bacterium]|jgi:hypothetical protein|nr:hypothetical protein [Myxococcales bacterium]